MDEAKHEEDESFEGVLGAARRGEGWAFDRLFRNHSTEIRAFARLRGVEDPDAMANAVLFAAFRQIDGFEGDESRFRSWIYRIARNKIVDEFRHRARRPRSADIEVDDEMLRVEPASETLALDRVSLDDTAALLATLTEEQREVVVLRFVLDLSIDQVADIVGRPVSAVKALQRRGLASLRRSLDGQVVSK